MCIVLVHHGRHPFAMVTESLQVCPLPNKGLRCKGGEGSIIDLSREDTNPQPALTYMEIGRVNVVYFSSPSLRVQQCLAQKKKR